MARRGTTIENLRTAPLGFGLLGFGTEPVGATRGGDAGRPLVTAGALLTVCAAIGFGRLWARVWGRQLLDRWGR